MHVTMIDVSHVQGVQVGDLVLLHGCCDGEGGPSLKKPLSLAAVSIGVPRIPKWEWIPKTECDTSCLACNCR